MNTTHTAIPAPAPRIPNGAWAGLLEQPHPRLLGPAGFVQERARQHPDLYESFEKRELLLARGIVHAIDGLDDDEIQRWIAKALAELERGVTNEHQDTWIWLTNVALTFDLFYDHIPAADRKRMIDWMNPHLTVFTDDENAFHNSTPSKALCYLRIAYATWGDNPMAPQFRDHALGKLYEQRMLPVLREFGAGGCWTECGWYERHSVWHGAEALELARRVEGYDGFPKAARFWYQRLAYEIFVTYPRLRPDGTEEFAVEGDGSDRYWQGDDSPRLLAYLLSDYFRGSELARYTMNRRNHATAPGAKVLEFLYRPDLDQEPLPMDTFPRAHLATGIGKVYARSDWTPDATWFRFECSDYWCGHQHYEVGNFEIFRHETLAAETGEYYDYVSNHDVNWLIRTIAHNCLLVHMPGETWSRMRDGGRNTYHNDGGQTKKWEWPVPDLQTWQARRESFHRGDIVAFDDRPGHLFVAADCTPAYVPEKLQRWIRQIVFLRPHTFVIFDRVVSTRPEYRKTWLLHSRFEPQCEGDRITITNGKGRLITQRLLPLQAEVVPVYGYTYDGATFEPNGNRLADTACKWRVEVSPSAPAKEDLFLHVLTTDEPVPATLLPNTAGITLRIGDTELRFTGDVGGTLRVGEETFALERVVRPTKYG